MIELQGVIERLNSFIERDMKSLNFPGLAIGATNRQRLLFVGEYGLANQDAQIPVALETLFQIGSISKVFTSIILLRLQEQGILDLGDPISKFLPWFEVQSEFAPITLVHLMSHTAGIVRGSDETPSAYTETWNLRHTRATTPPGERFHYSNSGYKILGLVLQSVLKQSMADMLRDQILEPLGMKYSEPVISNAIRSRLATGYEPFFDDRPLPRGGRLAPATWLETDTADGSISSNAEDMCRFLRFLLNHGHDLLTRESFRKLIEPIIPMSDDFHGDYYGFGLTICKIDSHTVIGHSGGMVGYTADMVADLDSGLGVVVLTNGPGDPQKISKYLLAVLRASKDEHDLPGIPDDDLKIDRPEDYAGRYCCRDKVFTLVPRKKQLHLEYIGDEVVLEPRDPGYFFVPHPAFEMYTLQMVPKEGQIKEAFHGPDWYVRDQDQGNPAFETPEAWQAYVGHYRSHNPWMNNFRIVVQKDQLVLIHPWESAEPLQQTGHGTFCVGTDPRSPEFINFGTIIDGKAMYANLSGGDYCRIFSP